MIYPRTWAQLRVTPSGYFGGGIHTAELQELEGRFLVKATESRPATERVPPPRLPLFPEDFERPEAMGPPGERHWEVEIPAEDARHYLEALRGATVPAFLVSPPTCDGEYVELTVKGEQADLTLGWWTLPPEGADVLVDFAYWLYDLVMPSDEDCDEDFEEGSDEG